MSLVQTPEREQALLPVDLHVHVDTHVSAERHLGRKIAAGALAVAGAVGLWAVADNLNLPHIPSFPDVSGLNPGQLFNHPPKVEAGLVSGTTTVQDTFDISCKGRLSAGVSVYGNKDELLGGTRIDKILFTDWLPCGDTIPADVQLTKQGGEVTKVDVATPGLVVTQASVNHEDFRNCVPLRHGDNARKIEQKINKWEKKEKAGKDPGCDSGYSITGAFVVGGQSANIKDTANTAAQIVTAVDARPTGTMQSMNDKFLEEVRTQIQTEYPHASVDIHMTSTAQQVKERLAKVVHDLKHNFYKVKIIQRNGKGKSAIKVSAPGGGEVTAKIDSIDLQDVNIQAILHPVSGTPAKKQ